MSRDTPAAVRRAAFSALETDRSQTRRNKTRFNNAHANICSSEIFTSGAVNCDVHRFEVYRIAHREDIPGASDGVE